MDRSTGRKRMKKVPRAEWVDPSSGLRQGLEGDTSGSFTPDARTDRVGSGNP
jgi:hypothetical protein